MANRGISIVSIVVVIVVIVIGIISIARAATVTVSLAVPPSPAPHVLAGLTHPDVAGVVNNGQDLSVNAEVAVQVRLVESPVAVPARLPVAVVAEADVETVSGAVKPV